ncbi:hypothetical protein [Limnospira indica]|uniref:hypothetical protein n=1 Tax=Limnospira indica TaxID=147322 RepID=UPI000662502D|nr:hypothetical protein [Limnospira indica]
MFFLSFFSTFNTALLGNKGLLWGKKSKNTPPFQARKTNRGGPILILLGVEFFFGRAWFVLNHFFGAL